MNKYISIKVILDRLLRHPLMQELQFETAVDYAVDFMRIVGCNKMFEEYVEKVQIVNYRADLSRFNIYKILGVRKGDVYFKYADDSFHPALIPTAQYDSYTPTTQEEALKYNGYDSKGVNDEYNEYLEISKWSSYVGTFEFVNNMKLYYNTKNANNAPTYKIQGSCLFTSIKEGEVEIAYIGIKTDEGGYPMILDNSSYLRALELYIKKQWFTVLFDMGKIQGPVLQNVQQEYAWAVGDCESEFNRMTLDQAEYFYNTMKNIHSEDYGFKHLGG